MEAETAQNSLLQKAVKHRGRVTELAIGLSANRLLEIGFDYLLYPYVVFAFGILRGGLVMGALSGLACILLIRFYDWSGRDWLGIEAIKSLKAYEGGNMAARLARWFMNKGDLLFFLFLSVRYDPFITMVYMRHGRIQRHETARLDNFFSQRGCRQRLLDSGLLHGDIAGGMGVAGG